MSFKLFAEVKPQSKKPNIEKISEQEYRIAVHAVPVAGKANQEVVELLARYFSVRGSSVKVLRGRKAV